jgi:phosphatidylethanolamine-binding protein (PEBP) family uncharacterized protein
MYYAVSRDADQVPTQNELGLEQFGYQMELNVKGVWGKTNEYIGQTDIFRIDEDVMRNKIDQVLQNRFIPYNKLPQYGFTNWETPWLQAIRGTLTPNRATAQVNYETALQELMRIYQILNTEYPFMKWSDYGWPMADYFVPRPGGGNDTWDCNSSNCIANQEEYINFTVTRLAPLAEYMGFLAPSIYKRYRLAAYCDPQSKLSQDIAYAKANIEIARKFRLYVNRPTLEIIPFVSAHHAGNQRKSVGPNCPGTDPVPSCTPEEGIEPLPEVVGNPNNCVSIRNDQKLSVFGPGENGIHVNGQEFMDAIVKPIVDSGVVSGVYFWHWYRGMFNVFPTSNHTENSVVLRKARIRFHMMQENDFGFESYTAPFPTEDWRQQKSTIESKMEEYYYKSMLRRMQDFKEYSDDTYLRKTARETTLSSVKEVLEDKLLNKTAAIPIVVEPDPEEFYKQVEQIIDPDGQVFEDDFMGENEDIDDTDEPT